MSEFIVHVTFKADRTFTYTLPEGWPKSPWPIYNGDTIIFVLKSNPSSSIVAQAVFVELPGKGCHKHLLEGLNQFPINESPRSSYSVYCRPYGTHVLPLTFSLTGLEELKLCLALEIRVDFLNHSYLSNDPQITLKPGG